MYLSGRVEWVVGELHTLKNLEAPEAYLWNHPDFSEESSGLSIKTRQNSINEKKVARTPYNFEIILPRNC